MLLQLFSSSLRCSLVFGWRICTFRSKQSNEFLFLSFFFPQTQLAAEHAITMQDLHRGSIPAAAPLEPLSVPGAAQEVKAEIWQPRGLSQARAVLEEFGTRRLPGDVTQISPGLS